MSFDLLIEGMAHAVVNKVTASRIVPTILHKRRRRPRRVFIVARRNQPRDNSMASAIANQITNAAIPVTKMSTAFSGTGNVDL